MNPRVAVILGMIGFIIAAQLIVRSFDFEYLPPQRIPAGVCLHGAAQSARYSKSSDTVRVLCSDGTYVVGTYHP